MNVLNPLFTSHPITGAQRRITLDILRETYLVPRTPPADIAALIAGADSPWRGSFENAPLETVSAVSASLHHLMFATRRLEPSEVDLRKFARGSRLQSHVDALLQLWLAVGDGLPADLQVIRHVIHSDGSDALEALPIIEIKPTDFSTTLDYELYSVLVRHHGIAPPDAQQQWRGYNERLFCGALEGSSLSRAQRGFTQASEAPMPLDGSLSFWSVRDLAEEAELAAAMSQRLTDQGVASEDIGILLPDDASYHEHLGRAFASAGIALSGISLSPPRRDIATETLLHFVLALNVPAPAMVLASLYVSPLMPWPSEIGAKLAREVMRGRYQPEFTKEFKGKAERVFRVLRDQRDRDAAWVSAQLDLLVQCLTDNEAYRDEIASLRTKVIAIKSLLVGGGRPNWEQLLELLNPAPPVASSSDRFVEGVSVFSEAALPWRPTKHLIVLGTVAGRYPRATSASSMFLDSELAQLKAATGLQIPGRAEQLAFGLELFRQQFLVASETCRFLCPVRKMDGSRQSTSTALALIARTISDPSKSDGRAIEEPQSLIRDIRSVPEATWPCFARPIASIGQNVEQQMPADGLIKLDRNLFEARTDVKGRARRQSPSRLEKLLISPLAWALSEFGAEEVIWAPETYDHILSGTLAHDVLENLFPKENVLPEVSDIDAKVGVLLDQAIRKYAPFLNSLLWKVERQGLERDIIRDAKKWRIALLGMNARIIDNEINLLGEAHGLALFGRADCLLSLPDGRLLIIDHKKSGSKKRRARMEAGWDLQLGLYRDMLLCPALEDGVLKDMLQAKPEIGVAYHLINDSGVLINGIQVAGEGIEIIDTGISDNAIHMLQGRISDVTTGTVRLNSTTDHIFFEKTAKITPYALQESTFVAAFLIPSETDEDNTDD